MDKIHIICVDDERMILDQVVEDLVSLPDYFVVEACESASEAWDVLQELDEQGEKVGVIVSDQMMPAKCGVEFLKEVS